MVVPATLTGLAVGDSLGMPFETQHFLSDNILNWDGSFQASTFHKLAPGQWTDDTMMSKCLAESLLEFPKFNPGDTAQRYLNWYESGDHRGMGNTTKEALRRLHTGTPWFQSGIPGAEGNGPAMRAAPLGLFYRNDLKIVRSIAHIEASITHDSEAAREGASAVALGVALLAQQCSPNEVLGFVIEHLMKMALTDAGGIVSQRLIAIEASLKSPIPLEDLSSNVALHFNVGAHIMDTVASAFYILGMTKDYASAVTTAIRAGGDTDTRAAIVGALAGTYYGIEQVEPFLPQLEQADRLQQLERNLYLEGALYHKAPLG